MIIKNKKQKTKNMKKYNYFNYGISITKKEFVNNVPTNWEDNLNEFDEYSYGGYRAILID